MRYEYLVLLKPNFFLVPGVLKNEYYKQTPEGLQISEIDTIPKKEQSGVENLVRSYFTQRLGREVKARDGGEQKIIFW